MKKIAVIGSINMDLSCTADRHPGKGETVSGRDLKYIPGGKGANQAVAAARLGGDVTMFGCVGDDPFGQRLLDNLRKNGVNTDFVRTVSGISSGIAMITVAQGDNSIVVIPGANGCVTPEYLEEGKDALLKADIFVVQNEIPQQTVLAVGELARKNGKALIYNPAPAMPIDRDVLETVTYLTPNEHEADLLFPEISGTDAQLKAMEGRLIITLGAEGAAALVDGQTRKIPTRKARVVDTTGAGDTFNGALAYAIANDFSLERAISFANVAASLSTEGYGAQGGMPTLDAVLREME